MPGAARAAPGIFFKGSAMVRRSLLAAAIVMAAARPVFAQETGAGGFGAGSSAGEAGGSVRALNRFEQFTGKLKADKTQTPEISTILQGAATDAAPIGQQMIQL